MSRIKLNKNGVSKYIIVFIVFLLIFNLVVGCCMIGISSSVFVKLMDERMLDIANTAAAMIDGDVLKNLTAEDKGTEEYNQIMRILRDFSDNITLDYIYCIQDKGNKEFAFGLDPDIENPADFDEPFVYTDALYHASLGYADVDKEAYEDEWGTFYSAYSPVFDSNGEVAGIVAVDFTKDWYLSNMRTIIWSIIIAIISSLIVGMVLMLLIVKENIKSIHNVHNQLNELEENYRKLMSEIRDVSGINVVDDYSEKKEEIIEDNTNISSLGDRILSLQNLLFKQIKLVHEQAFLDTLTGVKNKNSYMDIITQINELIPQELIDFSVILFDLNGLKVINDDYGHEFGDIALVEITNILTKVFDKDAIYRIGGDEFVVLLETSLEKVIKDYIANVEEEIEKENSKEKGYTFEIAISKGYAIYDNQKDKEYVEVFRRADQMMYKDKSDFYKNHQDRRKR